LLGSTTNAAQSHLSSLHHVQGSHLAHMFPTGKADQDTIRRHNASLAMNELWRYAPLSRAELAKRIGVNRSTISGIVARLLDAKLILETRFRTDRVGRPGLLLEVNTQGVGAIGVEIGLEYVHVLLTDLAGQPLWRRRILIGAGEEQETYVHIAEEMTRQALTTAEEAELLVCGIGLILPGLVDAAQGALRYAPGLRLVDAQFRSRWAERFDLPVIVENNANAGALAEFYFGVARDIADFIYIASEPGIGGGIMARGELLRGENGFAGEIGHMCIVPNGEACGCGKRGCWETLIGPKALISAYHRRARDFNGGAKMDVNGIGLSDLAEAASLSDVAAGAVLREAGRYLGIGIANLVNIFNPKIVILGGALGEIGDTLIPVARETVKEESLFPMRDSLTILPSAQGTDDSVLGAVSLVLDSVLRAPV